MTDGAMEDYLPRISEAIAGNTGLSFPRERWKDLDRALKRAAADLNFDNVHSCVEWLLEPLASASRIEDLAPYLTVGETHFFRDGKLFQALEELVLPELINTRQHNGRTLRFWSAGCATGEEPYSVAMLLNKAVCGPPAWHVTVLATDINRHSLKKAREGAYTHWSFREVPQGIREAYFTEDGERIEIIGNIKSMVKFSYLNLARDTYPRSANDTAAMDLIFCRNVLMYFTEEQQKRVVDNLCSCLLSGGWLIVSPAEATIVDNPKLTKADIPGAVLFRKAAGLAAKAGGSHSVLSSWPFDTPDNTEVEFTPWWWAPPDNLLPEALPTVTPDEEPETDQLVPVSDAVRMEQGIELYDQGLYSEAAEKLALELEQSHWEESEHDSKISLLIRSCGNQGKLDEALKWAEKAIATNKLNAEYHFLHGMILQEQGNLVEATLSLNKAIFLDPDFVVVHFALGNLALLRGNRKESDRHHRIALRVLRTWPEDEFVPSSDGMTAGRLKEIIVALGLKENLHGIP